MPPRVKKADGDTVIVQSASRRVTRSGLAGIYNKRTSPNRILAFELLDMIFIDVVHHGVTELEDWTVPLKLSHVCKRWRTALHNSPYLWSHIYVASTKNCVARVKFWLAKAGDRPLDIFISDHGLRYKATRDQLEAMMQLILPLSAQWRSLSMDFRLEFVPIAQDFFAKLQLPMNALESFEMSAIDIPSPIRRQNYRYNYRPPNSKPLDVKFLENSPKMRCLSINFCGPHIHSEHPWIHLITRIELKEMRPSFQYIHKLLATFHNLETLIYQAQSYRVDAHHQVTHNRLRNLTISYPPIRNRDGRGSGLCLLQALILPVLTSLSVVHFHPHYCHLGTQPTAYVGKIIREFMSRTPTIRELVLDEVSIDGGSLLEGLKHVSSLSTLSITGSSDLQPILSSTSAVPSLHTLRLHECDTLTPDALEAFLRRRSPSGDTLMSTMRYLEIAHCSLITPEDGNIMRELGKGWLTVASC